jgi:hypothetical protein
MKQPKSCTDPKAAFSFLDFLAAFYRKGEAAMTIRQRGKEGICESQFWIEGTFYQFTFNGKDDRPLITSKKKAKEQEYELKREIRMGTILKDSELKNFAKFFDQIYMDYSRKLQNGSLYRV